MARQLLLIRHASIAPEYAGRYVGSTDVPLGGDAQAETARLREWIKDRRVGRWYVSPLLRARQTAERMGLCGGNLRIDADLREVDFGQWEAKAFDEISANWSGEVKRWSDDYDAFAFPGGESIGGFLERVGRMAERMIADSAEVVGAVTHGGVIRAMICRLLGLSPRQYVLFNVRCATCTTIDVFGSDGVLSGLNEACGATEGC